MNWDTIKPALEFGGRSRDSLWTDHGVATQNDAGTTGTCHSPRLRPQGANHNFRHLTCTNDSCPQNPRPLLLRRNSQLVPRRATTGGTLRCGQLPAWQDAHPAPDQQLMHMMERNHP